MKKLATATALMLAFTAFESPAIAQPGSLDTTFDTDGKVTTPVGSSEDDGRSVAIQSDGKIVVAGYSYNGANYDIAVVRYNTDGSLDTTFDADGKVNTPVGSSDDYGRSVAIQSDGKIVVAGYSSNGTDNDFAVVRYNTDGSLDTTFDTDGKIITPIGSSYEESYSATIQSNGKIVVAGYSWNGADYDFAIVRYNINGSLDITFDTDGKVTTPVGSSNDKGYSVAIQSDGKIVVAGYSDNGANADFAVVRYNIDGSLDNTFDTDGKVTTPVGIFSDYGYSVAIQSDGKIVVAGNSYNGVNNDFAVVRYNIDGSLDTTFDTDGIVTTPVGSFEDYGWPVAIQSNGKIVVAGYSGIGTNWDFAVVRYNIDGSLDNTFDTDGKVTTSFGSYYDYGYSVAIQSDGKIVVAGGSNNGTNTDIAVVRYNVDCTPVSSSQSPTICQGESVTVGSNTYTAGGNYIDTLTAASGCDSIVTTNLTVLPDSSSSSSQSPTICLGDSVTVGSNTYTAGGTYMDTLTAANGCDSIVTTNLTVLPNSSFSQSPTICQGDSVTVGSSTYTVGGTYMDTLTAANGCDSIVTTNLTVDSTYGVTVDTTINNGDSITVGNSVYTTTGTYTDTLTASNGCDSIVITNLTVLTGISDIAEQNIKVSIYPNPFSHTATIEISDSRWTKGVLLIYNLLGQTVHQQTLAGKLETLWLQLPGGIYFYKLKSEEATVPINRDGKIMVFH